MTYAQQAHVLAARLGFLEGSANSLNIAGRICEKQANYPKALEYHFKALKLREQTGDKQGIAGSYNNIGNCYMLRGDNAEALSYYFKALKLNEETGNRAWQAKNLTNIGIIYDGEKQYSKALEYYSMGLKIHEELGNNEDVGNSLNNIGFTYWSESNYPMALEYYFKALKIKSEINDKYGTAETLNNIGNTYAKQKKYQDALDYCNKSLAVARAIGSTDDVKEAEQALSAIYEAIRQPARALEHYKAYITTRDSIFNEENTKKTVRAEMNFDFDKKEALLKADNEKRLALVAAERERSLVIIILVSIGFVITVAFSVFITKERSKSERLLLNILPKETALELKRKSAVTPKRYEMVTVMFTDFMAFTSVAAKMTPETLVNELDYVFKKFDEITRKYPVEKIKTIGDSYMCAAGLPIANSTNPADIVNVALEIIDFTRKYKQERSGEGKEYFEVRIGIHTGPVVAGVVGDKKFAYDIWGDTVNVASRMESSGHEGKVNISGETYRYLCARNGDLPFRYTFRERIPVRNKGEIEMYFVERARNGDREVKQDLEMPGSCGVLRPVRRLEPLPFPEHVCHYDGALPIRDASIRALKLKNGRASARAVVDLFLVRLNLARSRTEIAAPSPPADQRPSLHWEYRPICHRYLECEAVREV